MVTIPMKRLLTAIPFLLIVPALWAQGLSLTIGNSVAGQNFAMKSAAFVFRVNGCADLSKVQITATAEGIVGNARRSVPVNPIPSQPAGVWAIGAQWSAEGKWVVNIAATCQNETAGAIVPVSRWTFDRATTQLLTHAPTSAEVEAALKASRF
jgi:hypothetical protein